MKRMMFVLFFSVAFFIAGCGSSNADNADTRIAGDNSGRYTVAILREFEDRDGNKYTCTVSDYQPDPGNPAMYDCVKEGTQEAYNCVLDKDGPSDGPGIKFQFCNIKKAKYKPPCDKPLRIGDGRSGRQCWNLPTDYCKYGKPVPIDAWYCSRDGAHCCHDTNSGCFLCGWVKIDPSDKGIHCYSIEEDYRELPGDECETIWKTWKKHNNCTTGMSCTGIAHDDPVCQGVFKSMANFKGICPVFP